VYATMLNMGSKICTSFIGPKSVEGADDGADALLPLSAGVVLPAGIAFPADAELPDAPAFPPAVACPPHAATATSAVATRIPNADFVFIDLSVPTWPGAWHKIVRKLDAPQPNVAVYISSALRGATDESGHFGTFPFPADIDAHFRP